jgi:hypothetical protein
MKYPALILLISTLSGTTLPDEQQVPVVQGDATYTCMVVPNKVDKMDCVITITLPPMENKDGQLQQRKHEPEAEDRSSEPSRIPSGKKELYIPQSNLRLGI